MGKSNKTELIENAEGTDVVETTVEAVEAAETAETAAEKELDEAIDAIIEEAASIEPTSSEFAEDEIDETLTNLVDVEFIASPMGFNLSYNIGDVATLREGQAKLLEAKKICVIL